jgi:acetyl esterase/lipase
MTKSLIFNLYTTLVAAFLAFALAGVPPLRAAPPTPVTVNYRPDLGAQSPKLDIYSFANAENAPVVIFVHGGTWQEGDRSQGPKRVRLFTDAGFVYVSIDYRLVPSVRIEDELVDVEHAIKWVSDHIGDYGGDGGNIQLFGHSAGAHLVTLTAIAPRSVAQGLVQSGAVRSVYASDLHSYDFIRFGELYNWNIPPAIARALGTDRARIAALSPLQQLRPGVRNPAFLIGYSSQRSAALRRETAIEFATALRQAGGYAELLDGTRFNHRTISLAVGQDAAYSAAVLGFFRQQAGL